MVLVPFSRLNSLIFLDKLISRYFMRLIGVHRWYLYLLIYLLIEHRTDWTKSLNDHQSDSSYSEPFTERIKRAVTNWFLSPDEKPIEMLGSDDMSVLTYLLLNCCLKQSQLEFVVLIHVIVRLISLFLRTAQNLFSNEGI